MSAAARATSIERYREERDERETSELREALAGASSNLQRATLVMNALSLSMQDAMKWLEQRGLKLRQERCAHCNRMFAGRVAMDLKRGLAFCTYFCQLESEGRTP